MNKSYAQGIHVPLTQTGSQTLRGKFDQFLSQRYEVSAQYARIKGYQDTRTSSEDQALAMLLCVYFSDSVRSYQNEFDQLYAYYNQFRNGNKLMYWAVNGFSGPDGGSTSAIISADMDVAIALFMAAKQFPAKETEYTNQAIQVASEVAKKALSPDNLLNPSDMWFDRIPGWTNLVALRLFADENIGSNNWSAAIISNFSLLDGNAHPSTGLFSDACSNYGVPIPWNNNPSADYFGWYAVTTPIRLAMDYYWYGDSRANTRLQKIANWVETISPNNIKTGYRQDGTPMGSNSSPLFTIALASSTITTSEPYLENGYSHYMVGDNYGPADLMAALLITGNMHNLREQ
jgi:hypothetical protein